LIFRKTSIEIVIDLFGGAWGKKREPNMEVKEILEEFRQDDTRFPREAMLGAIEKREEIIPHLLQIIEETIARAGEIADDPSNMAHLFALYLLAQFRERRAYPSIIRLFSLPAETVDQIGVDFLPAGLGTVLASVAGGDPSLIKELVEKRDASIWARMGALWAIPAMVGAGELSREAALAYFQELIQGKLEREPLPAVGELWEMLIRIATALHPEEIYPDIKLAYEAGLLENGIISLGEVDQLLAGDKQEALRSLPYGYQVVTDAIAEMDWWECFDDEDDDEEEIEEEQEELAEFDLPPSLLNPTESISRSELLEAILPFPVEPPWDPEDDQPAPTIVREAHKVGRNDPCSCGSGKKYKKCCGK
jgi:uncharacterized protein DUF1186/SEC-C motif-containing protein